MTEPFNFANHPHRRRNPLTDDWVLVSPHRNKRPWQGQIEPEASKVLSTYDASCYLCPGNQRMSGASNPDYIHPFVFDNDFPALTDTPQSLDVVDPLFTVHAESGACRVVSYSPDHSKSLAELSTAEINQVVACWIEQNKILGERFPWVQIFENKGEMMGCSMPHPHGQIWAQSHAPTLLLREETSQRHYHADHGRALLLDYAQRELEDGSRVVVNNDDWVAVVPFWAAWPFETMLLPRFSVARLTELNTSQGNSLAQLLGRLLARYDNLFECSFPYSMGWHGGPYNNKSLPHWQLHAHFYPPLLRSQNVRKFMVGYEMFAEAQRDLTPEQAAAILRALPATHYKNRKTA